MVRNSPEVLSLEQRAQQFIDGVREGSNPSIEQPLTPEIEQAIEQKMNSLDEANRAQIRLALDKLKLSTVQVVETPYLSRNKAFSEALMAATSFPFTVKYTENGKSYEVEVVSRGDTITIGGKSFQLHDFAIVVNQISINQDKILISSTQIKKTAFKDYIESLLMKDAGTYNVGSGLESGKITISGELQPKEIETPKTTVDKTLLEKIKTLQAELDKRINEGLDPVELLAGFEYISRNVNDESTKQMAINYLLHMVARDYTIVFEKNGSLNVIPKDVKNTATAAQYQNALQSSLNATHVSRANIQESMTMLTGQKWSDYARTIADPKTASAQGYAKYLADTYGLDIEKKPISQIQNHKTMTAEDKAWLLSYLNGQMGTLDVAKVTGMYQENLKSYQTLIDSPFFALLNKTTGGKSLTPEQARAAAEAAARGSNEGGGDGKTATWTLGILGAIVGLGFKKGEGWSLWTALKRIFMGGLAIGGVMLGCAAGREWKKELGMDVCEEAKKALKDGINEMKNGITNTATGAAAAPVALATGAQQAPAVGPTLTSIIARTPSQDKGYQAMKGAESQINASIEGAKKRNPKLTGTIDQYEEFIRSSDFQSQKLSGLIFTSDPKNSIITPSSSFLDLEVAIPPHLDNSTLKLVLRTYLGIGLEASGTPNSSDWGKAEKDAFIAKAKIDDTWKDKTIADLTSQIYS